MDEYQKQLKQYISSHLQAGTAPENIRAELLRAGWPADMVADAFTQLQGLSLPAPVAVPETDKESAPQATAEQPIGTTSSNATGPAAEETDRPSASAAEKKDTEAPRQYTVSRSIIDGLKAMKHNFPAYISAAVSSFLIAATAIGLIALAATAVAQKIFHPEDITAGNGLAGLVLTVVVVMISTLVFYVVAYAFISAAISYPLMSGADNKRDNVFAVLLHALKRTPKLILVNITIYMIAIIPTFVVLALLVGLLFSTQASASRGSGGLLILVPLLELGTLFWAILVFFRYSLAPFVLMFEEKDTIRQALSRSRFLLKGNGTWFLVKGAILIFIIMFIFLTATGQSLQNFQQVDSIWNDIIAIVLAVLINNSLVMLYRNRRAVRGTEK